jgi:transposase
MDKMMLWISKKIPKPQPYQPRDAIAVDINERKIVYGDDKINKERDTRSMKPIDGRSLPRISRRNTPLQGILHGGGEKLY